MSRLVGPVTAELGIPSMGHIRDIVSLSAKAMADVNCNTRLLAVSHATRDYHVAAGLDADKAFVLYNGVDLQRFLSHDQPDRNMASKVAIGSSCAIDRNDRASRDA